MGTSSRWHFPGATAFQLATEAFWVVLAVFLAFQLRGASGASFPSIFVPAMIFAILMVAMLSALGMYRSDRKIGIGAYSYRLVVATLFAVPLAYLAAEAFPGGRAFQDAVRDWAVLAFIGLVIVRKLVSGWVLKTLLPHRVLVLGTGPEARVVEASLTATEPPGVKLVGYYELNKTQECVVPRNRIVSRTGLLEDTVRRLNVDEIIVAVREQRGGVLPLRSLLECRLAGVRVTDLARFFERVHGQIPIDSLKASWLIYGHGFRQNWWRTFVKRTFDIVVSLAMLAMTAPLMVLCAIIIAFETGFPVVYRQERVGLRGKGFDVLKFRSMRKDAEKDGKAQWAKVQDSRVTPWGRVMRRTRLDELPQLINVLRGEMSFVGPRPERPVFVEMLTEQVPFYAVRHSVKPGLTGWAQVRYSYGADVEQSVKKLEFDLYYVKNHTLLLDILILIETARVVASGDGAR